LTQFRGKLRFNHGDVLRSKQVDKVPRELCLHLGRKLIQNGLLVTAHEQDE
jgi:hypothetical protein